MKKYLLLAGIVGFLALLFAVVGASTLTVFPTFHLRLVEPMICGPDQTLAYEESATYTYTDSEGTHRRANISITCVSADGTPIASKEAATIGLLTGIYFLLCFVPLFGLGAYWLSVNLNSSLSPAKTSLRRTRM